MAKLNAEKALIGAVLQTNGNCLDDVSLSPSQFFDPKMGKIFRVMLEMRNKQKPIDAITLYENPDFRSIPDVNQATAWELTDGVIYANNAEYYARLISEDSVRRELAYAGQAIAEDAGKAEYEYLVESARKRIDICEACPSLFKATKQCKECGCFMNLKTKLTQAVCPIGKW